MNTIIAGGNFQSLMFIVMHALHVETCHRVSFQYTQNNDKASLIKSTEKFRHNSFRVRPLSSRFWEFLEEFVK